MLGRQSPQGELFRPDNLFRDHVGRESFYGALSRTRGRVFKDESFAGLYGKHGRPSVPPSQLCVALVLQVRDGVSDDEAIQRTAYDLRWKVALGLDLQDKLCAKSTLQLFRAKLILHEKYQAIFEASVEECRKQGLLKGRKLEVAIDTTPILGRGAVKDTFNLISDQISRLVKEIVALKGYELDEFVAKNGLGRHFASSLKAQFDLDWDDAEQKRAVVAQLVADGRVALELAKAALRGHASEAEKTQGVRDAQQLLADLLLQDVDEKPEDGGTPQIRRGTARDRIVSTTDPEMRHGRKSRSKRFDGYKASVAVDTKTGVFLSTDVHAANKHDGEKVGELLKGAAEVAGQDVARVLGDTAYGGNSTRQEIAKATNGAELVAKVPPVTSRKGAEFTVEDFDINPEGGVATCPQGKKSIRYERPKGTKAHRFTFSQRDCNDCPVRSKCTTAKKVARNVTVSENYRELSRLRKQQRTKGFKRAYRRRVKVEHRIARLVQLGVRQARYVGRCKVAFQVSIAAAVANLVLACSTGSRRPGTRRGVLSAAQGVLRVLWAAVGTLVGRILTTTAVWPRIRGIQVVLDDLRTEPTSGVAQFAFAANGTLGFAPGGANRSNRELWWLDRAGKLEQAIAERRPYSNGLEISPDGRAALVGVEGANDSVWRVDLERRMLTQLTFEGNSSDGFWSDDGRAVVFTSDRGGGIPRPYTTPANGGGQATLLSAVVPSLAGFKPRVRDLQPSLTGEWLVVVCGDPQMDIVLLPRKGDAQVEVAANPNLHEWFPRMSPDGQLIYFHTSTLGDQPRSEFFVQSLERDRTRIQLVAEDSLHIARWAPDGNSIFLLDVDSEPSRLEEIRVRNAGRLEPGARQFVTHVPRVRAFAPHPDGRFLIVREIGSPTGGDVLVRLHWFQQLQQLVPVRR